MDDRFFGVAPGWRPWAMAIAAGIFNMVASLSLYHSFEIGTMSIVGPVSSSYPALTVALSLLSGERIHALRGAGLAVTLVGVILAATSFAPQAKSATAVAPEGSAAAAGGETAHAHLSNGVGWAIFAARWIWRDVLVSRILRCAVGGQRRVRLGDAFDRAGFARGGCRSRCARRFVFRTAACGGCCSPSACWIRRRSSRIMPG